MSVSQIQSRIIQNTRPGEGASKKHIEKKAKPDRQNLHAAPGAPSEPPDDPNKDIKSPGIRKHAGKVRGVTDEMMAAYDMMPALVKADIMHKGFYKEFKDMHPNPVLNVLLNYIYNPKQCWNYLKSNRLTTEDLRNIFSLDPKFKFQNRYGFENLEEWDTLLAFEDSIDLREFILDQADLRAIKMQNPRAPKASFEGADLSGSIIYNGNFEGANLKGAKLVNGVYQYNSFNDAKLSEADFSGSVVCQNKFTKADLFEANFDQTNILGSFFERANLRYSSFKETFALTDRVGNDATATNFNWADLTCANFKGAILGRANFENVPMSGSIFSLGDKDLLAPANTIYLGGANLCASQIFLKLGSMQNTLLTLDEAPMPQATLLMSETNLSHSTIVNLVMFPDSRNERYQGFSRAQARGIVKLDGTYLRNVEFRADHPSWLKECRYTPDVVWAEGQNPEQWGAIPIEITDWSDTDLREYKFGKQFLIQSTMGKTEEEAAEIKSLDLSDANCKGADFTDFHEYMTLCNWQNTKIDNAKGVHKFMILQGATGNPQRPVFGFKSDAEAEEILRRARAGEFRDEGN